uniref:Protein fem-1 homolog B n=1 Tax=Suberites domuncula TaxID=55567 RepID=Q5K4G6_SUBDO|nr:fem-like sex-differentiation protein [Suberites domuncula]
MRTEGKLAEFCKHLENSPHTRKLFEERLQEPVVPKDQSPLVTTVISDRFNVFEYILEHYSLNIEQETSAVIEGGYPVEGATPLWTASTLGRLNFVKTLVKHGADIEHTTISKSTPLRGAAFDGHCDICEYLIECGADIDKPNQVGQSPLTIAAAMQKIDCVRLLIKKGANIKHRGHNGDTPLHVCVESGDVKIATLLVNAGAENVPNDVEFTPSILAACYGHQDVVMYLNKTFHLDAVEMYNCYCLLAAKEVLGGNDSAAEKWMTEAVSVRKTNLDLIGQLQADDVYDGIQEPLTLSDVQHIVQDESRMFFVSSIYCERILGRIHPTTAFYIRISGDMALAENRYQKCVDLWQRSLDFDNAARMAYELQITEDLLFAIRGFSIMASNGFIPPVQPHFKWGLKEFKLAHESKISEVSVVSCLFRMLAAWVRVCESIEDLQAQQKEKELIYEAAQDLIHAMDDNTCPLLIACLQNVPDHGSGAGKDVYSQKLPLGRVISLLIDHGCPIHCEDDNGNFPLHLAVMLKDESSPECIRTLIEYGAHTDAVNFNNKTALELAKSMDDPKPTTGVVAELSKASTHAFSLQCLASRAVIRNSVDYSRVLPAPLVRFVSWHERDQRGCGENNNTISSL